MNSNNPIRNYKHDIAGKFKDITTAISSMNETSFDDPENNEIFHAIHEVLLKMVKTSRNTMAENLKQKIQLQVVDGPAKVELPKLQIQGLIVRYVMTSEEMTYYYFTSENAGDAQVNCAIICSVLPV